MFIALIVVGIIIVALLIVTIVLMLVKKRTLPQREISFENINIRTPKNTPRAEINQKDIETVVNFIKTQAEEARVKQELKTLKTSELKQKLENFKNTKEELKDLLKNQIDKKDWTPLDKILSKRDKGMMGIYILYNETKNKYYVGQAKTIVARIQQHFKIEQIARDFCDGDIIKVKMLHATELNSDYRIDHIEKTAIEIFDSSASGYNKTTGNL